MDGVCGWRVFLVLCWQEQEKKAAAAAAEQQRELQALLKATVVLQPKVCREPRAV